MVKKPASNSGKHRAWMKLWPGARDTMDTRDRSTTRARRWFWSVGWQLTLLRSMPDALHRV